MSPIEGRLGQYELIEPIGQGAMGEVYKARDTKMFDRPVAIKVLPERYTKSKQALERFRREIQVASALQHPNIVTIHDHGALEKRMYYVMEYIDGVKLSNLVADPSSRPFHERLDIAIQICAGLQFIHRANIVHRDLKPGNIMVVRHGARDQVKLLDFGIALTEESNLTRSDAQPGTSSYMSPEQARGESIDHQSDIFSLGIVLYEFFSGRHPFAAPSESLVTVGILQDTVQPLNELRPDLPVELSNIIARALEKEPRRRPGSAGEIETILDWIRNRQVTTDTGAGPTAPTGDFLPVTPSTLGEPDSLDTAPTTLPPEDSFVHPDATRTGSGTGGSNGWVAEGATAASEPSVETTGVAPPGTAPGARKTSFVLMAVIAVLGLVFLWLVFTSGWQQVQRFIGEDTSRDARMIDEIQMQLRSLAELPCDDRARLGSTLTDLDGIRQLLQASPIAETDPARIASLQSELAGIRTAAHECLGTLDSTAATAAIESVIERWRTAYEARSVDRILEVYPTLEDSQGMRLSFSKMTRLQMTVEDLRVSHDSPGPNASGNATVDCDVRMVFRNEGAATDAETTVRSHFELTRDAGGDWVIARQEFVS